MIKLKHILSEQIDQVEWAEKHSCVGDEFIIGTGKSMDRATAKKKAYRDGIKVKESLYQLDNGDYYYLICYKAL